MSKKRNSKILMNMGKVHADSLTDVNNYLKENNWGAIRIEKVKMDSPMIFKDAFAKMEKTHSNFYLTYVGEMDKNIPFKVLHDLEYWGFVYSNTIWTKNNLIVYFEVTEQYLSTLRDLAEEYCEEFINVVSRTDGQKNNKIYLGGQYLGSYSEERYQDEILPKLIGHVMNLHSPKIIYEIFLSEGLINKNKSDAQKGTSKPRASTTYTKLMDYAYNVLDLSEEEVQKFFNGGK